MNFWRDTIELNSFVFMDFKTTGFSRDESNQTKIIEAAFVGFSKKHFLQCQRHCLPRVTRKLTLFFNPAQEMNPVAVRKTGLNNSLLRGQTIFDQNACGLIAYFLQQFEPPICLFAHFGYFHGFPILKKELDAFNFDMRNIYCVDTMHVFQKVKAPNQYDPFFQSFSLENLYREMFGTIPLNLHSAEGDAIALARIAIGIKDQFFYLTELNAVKFERIPTIDQ